jgi:heptosyltransferase III
MQRILIITSTRIGDAVLSSGVVDHLLRAYPQARFTIASGPLAAPLFAAMPQLERLIVMPKERYGLHWLRLFSAIAFDHFDLTLDFRGSLTTAFVHSKRRMIAARRREMTHKVIEASRTAGLRAPVAPVLWIGQADYDAARALVPESAYVVISPAASAPFKEWPSDRFCKLLAALMDKGARFENHHVIGLGGPGDVDRVTNSLTGLDRERTQNLAGRVTIPQAAAIISGAACFIGNDSGLMHIAAASGVATLGLFGPTDERLYGPWGPRAAIVRATPPPLPEARKSLRFVPESLMQDLQVAEVMEAIEQLLARSTRMDHS